MRGNRVVRGVKAIAGRWQCETRFLPCHQTSTVGNRGINTSRSYSAPKEDDSEDFWTVPASNTSFWDAYVSTRPKYSKDFYQLIYDHHASHSCSYETAHDVGCGAGQVAAELASHFRHVIASDNVSHHVGDAKSRLEKEFDESRITYLESKGENLASHQPAQSADLIASAEAVAAMDTADGLRSFATLLKPGGTFACWFYGRPTFTEDPYREECQRLLDTIMVLSWKGVIRGSGQKRMKGLERAAVQMASWLDCLHFPAETWTSVKRLKWNTRYGTLQFFGEEACGFPIRPCSNVGEGEEIHVRSEDPNFWRTVWDVGSIKEYFRVLFPDFEDSSNSGRMEIHDLFTDLAKAMGGSKQTRQLTWPCVLVLASKK